MATSNGNFRKGRPEDPLRCAIFISGSGSGMNALLQYQNLKKQCTHRTVLVISNNPDAGGIEIARNQGIPVEVFELPEIENKQERRLKHESEIDNMLENFNVELIILSGYMRLLSAEFVSKWNMKIVNIHPSLLPNFPGAHAHRDVLAAKAKLSGCTVHFVDSGMDTGKIIAQRKVPVFPNDTIETLSKRVKVEEHILYPLVIDELCK